MIKIWEWLVTKAYAIGPSDFTGWDSDSNNGLENNTFFGSGNITSTLDNVITRFAEIAGGLAFLALIVGAWQYLLAGGDENRAEAGKKTITWAIVGIVLVLIFYVIVIAVSGGIFQGKDITTP